MFNNYPSTYLLLLSLVIFSAIYFLTPIIGPWHMFLSIAMAVLKFAGTIVCVFFLLCAIIETAHNLFFRKHHH
jgi:hypothetical protein